MPSNLSFGLTPTPSVASITGYNNNNFSPDLLNVDYESNPILTRLQVKWYIKSLHRKLRNTYIMHTLMPGPFLNTFYMLTTILWGNIYLLSPFDGWKNWSGERSSELPTAPQLEGGRIQTHMLLTKTLCDFFYPHFIVEETKAQRDDALGLTSARECQSSALNPRRPAPEPHFKKIFVFKYLFILAAPGLSCGMQDLRSSLWACGIYSCALRTL